MTASALNDFLRWVAQDRDRRRELAGHGAREAALMARDSGFDVVVADLTRYKARATTWALSDAELEVVEHWQPQDQPYWWQCTWASD